MDEVCKWGLRSASDIRQIVKFATMNHTAKNKQLLIAGFLVLFAAFTRLTVHPFNMTAIGAIALFSGARLPQRSLAYLVPLIALFLSDLYIGLHDGMIPVYCCFLFSVLLGRQLSENSSPLRIGATSVLGSLVFYLVTNLPFFYPGMYTPDLAGALQSYAAALPFFRNQLLGDLVFTGLLFSIHSWATRLVAVGSR